MYDLFLHWCDERRIQTALRFGASFSWSYEELLGRTEAMRREIVAHHLPAHSRIALDLPRSPESVAAILAILGAGHTYVPLSRTLPPLLVAHVMKDSGAAAVFSSDGLTPLGSAADSEAWDVSPQGLLDDPAVSQVAYIIYTSGSFGRPKGVPVTHRSVLAMLAATLPLVCDGLADGQVWSAIHSLNFDFSVWEILGALASGAVLDIVPESVSSSPDRLFGYLASNRVTFLSVVPSVFRHLVEVGLRNSVELVDLETILFGGENVHRDSALAWFEFSQNPIRYINMYGLTEGTVHATFRRLFESDLRAEGPIPIGWPLPGFDFRVEPAPISGLGKDIGELWLSGPQVSAGYWNLPRETEQRFVTDSSGRRWYRTGDLVAHRMDAELMYVSRCDRQVQVRGHRIELEQVEVVTRRIQGVQAAVALAVPNPRGDLTLVVCVELRSGCSLTGREIRSQFGSILPAYMVPTRVAVVPEIPRLTSGKPNQSEVASLFW